MKRMFEVVLFCICLFSVVFGCEDFSAEERQSIETQKILGEMDRQVGMPNIHNYYEKKLAKDIFELRDKSNLVTYTYIVNLDGKMVFLGKSIGFGLPYSVQYTNPEKYHMKGAVLPQADPNGLYMPDGLSATWVILLDEKGKPSVTYTEPQIVVSPVKLPRRLCAEWSLPEVY